MRMGLRYKNVRKQKQLDVFQRYNPSKLRWELINAATGEVTATKETKGAWPDVKKEEK